jgi:hypothetical protein
MIVLLFRKADENLLFCTEASYVPEIGDLIAAYKKETFTGVEYVVTARKLYVCLDDPDSSSWSIYVRELDVTEARLRRGGKTA